MQLSSKSLVGANSKEPSCHWNCISWKSGATGNHHETLPEKRPQRRKQRQAAGREHPPYIISLDAAGPEVTRTPD